jgi:hypothetical protein
MAISKAIGMRNAYLPRQQVMRVGVPHKGGRLAFHAFEQGFPVMVSANAFWNLGKGTFQVPTATDLSECDLALDSAGFTAMQLWKTKGRQAGIAGIYPWTYAQYLELVSEVRPAWYAQPDLCCEPAVAGSADEVDYRVRATATLLHGMLMTLNHHHEAAAREGWSDEAIRNAWPAPVPVLQGWSVDNYLRSLDLMCEVWAHWEPWLAPPVLIGLGSVCRRNLHDPKHGLYAVLRALEGRLPTGARLHLFGVKGTALEGIRHLPWIASCDSMAYDFGARIDARKAGISNCMAHRSSAMSRWMKGAANWMTPRQQQIAACAGLESLGLTRGV